VHFKIPTLGLLLLLGYCVLQDACGQASASEETRVVIDSRGWELIGDLRLPESNAPVPAVLMLNKAAGDRRVYKELALQLATRNIASLRIDLPGHGESTNLGRFIPGEVPRSPLIWDAEQDVIAAHKFLMNRARIDANRIGIVGGSYSGEEMAEAGRLNGYAQAYVALSPGSFSDESISAIDSSGVAWLLIVSNNERFLREITAAVQQQSHSVQLIIVPGDKHATDILEEQSDIAERVAIWLDHRLRK
jgi:dienelactone hydrolase